MLLSKLPCLASS